MFFEVEYALKIDLHHRKSIFIFVIDFFNGFGLGEGGDLHHKW
jgi:hypothetical protein